MSISDVLAEYDSIRGQNKIKEDRRRQEVYKKVPELEELHRKKNTLQLERIKLALTNKSIDTKDILILRKKANKLLKDAGFDIHYLDPIFTCAVCHDTGIKDNSLHCDCFTKRILEDKLDQAKLTDKNICFEQFDIDIFDDTPTDNGKSQKDVMKKIKMLCEEYANSFPNNTAIFLLSGATGLGKTYLSKCIMRRVIERGYTSAFYTAYRLFSLFHRDRLSEHVDLRPIFSVPLLIIDDVGTEPMTRNVTVEYFFDLINERAASNLHTIIVTNLAFHELKERYGERIHSRLMDKRNSKKILFKGQDIRY